MSNKILSDGAAERNADDTTEDARPSLTRQPTFASMSGGLRGWLGNMTARNQSGDSVDAILPEGRYPRALSVVSGVEGRRPGLHSRRTSRGSQLVRERSSYRALRNRAGDGGPKAIVPSPNDSRFCFTAILPFVLSAAAFSFSLVLVLAGSNAGTMTDVNIISFNTTNLGTGIIEFNAGSSTTTATTSTTSTGGLGRRNDPTPSTIPQARSSALPSSTTGVASPTPTTFSTAMHTMIPSSFAKRPAFNPLDPLGLVPVLSSVVVSRASVDSSFLVSAGGAIASNLPTISLPGLPSPTSLTSAINETDGIFGALGSLIESGLTSLLSTITAGFGATGITQAVDDAINNEITKLISALIEKAGVQDYYSLYVLSTCSGNSSSSISDCSAFSSAANSVSNISDKIPSSIEVLGTNITSPALAEMTKAISSLGPMVSGLEKFFLALMILSLINSGVAIILAFLGIIFPMNRIILYANLSLASIGILTRGIDAILATTIAVTLNFIVNRFGTTIGVNSTPGGIFIALIWLGFVFQSVASFYWYGIWFVEFRQISFRIRKREVGEVGNYRGIFGEVVRDVRSPNEVEMKEGEAFCCCVRVELLAGMDFSSLFA